jgi:CRP/FNR family transcriptional activator FtrB
VALQQDVLRRIPLFRGLNETLLRKIAGIATLVAVPPGEVLQQRGVSPADLQFLLEGRVTLTGAVADGSSAVIDVLQPVAGISPAAVLANMPCPVAAQAVVASIVLFIAAVPMRALLAQAPALAASLMQSVASELDALVRQVVDLKLRSAPQRLGCYLLGLVAESDAMHADFRLPFDKGLLAARLGCRQENLSRAFATLREIGVETHGARVILHDIPALRDFAVPDATAGIDPAAGTEAQPAALASSP